LLELRQLEAAQRRVGRLQLGTAGARGRLLVLQAPPQLLVQTVGARLALLGLGLEARAARGVVREGLLQSRGRRECGVDMKGVALYICMKEKMSDGQRYRKIDR
jgi:hypothetical protein